MLAIIHHFENMFKVPYRFEKTFKINCIKDNQIKTEYFKLDVLKDKFRSKKRSFNKKIFEHFEQNKVLHNITLGKGKIYYFNIQDFYATTCELFEKDINCYTINIIEYLKFLGLKKPICSLISSRFIGVIISSLSAYFDKQTSKDDPPTLVGLINIILYFFK